MSRGSWRRGGLWRGGCRRRSWVARRRDLEAAARDLGCTGCSAVRLCQEGAPGKQRSVGFLCVGACGGVFPVALASEWRAEGRVDLLKFGRSLWGWGRAWMSPGAGDDHCGVHGPCPGDWWLLAGVVGGGSGHAPRR